MVNLGFDPRSAAVTADGRRRAASSAATFAFHATVLLLLIVGPQRVRISPGLPSGQPHAVLTFAMPAAVPAAPAPTSTAKPTPLAAKPPTAATHEGATSDESSQEPAGPVRLASGEAMLLKRVKPTYPPLMLSARMEGVVVLDAVIRRDGTIGDVTVLKSSTPVFEQAAVMAIRRWRYTPLPYEAVVTVTINFQLT